MAHIILMAVLGIIAGMIGGFWTRILKPDMIFASVGKWLDKKNNKHLISHNVNNPLIFLLRCVFCVTPWICFVLDVFYIWDEEPYWLYALIGVLASLGAGNFIAEVICSTRTE